MLVPNVSYKILVTKCQLQNFSYKILVRQFLLHNFSHKVLVKKLRLKNLVTTFQLQNFSYKILVTKFQLQNFSYKIQLQNISYEILVTQFQLRNFSYTHSLTSFVTLKATFHKHYGPTDTPVHEPSAKYYQLSCLHRRRWRKRRKIGIWVGDHQILQVLEVWRQQVQAS